MDRALGNALAVLVSELLEQLVVLQQDRAAGAGRDCILVVAKRIATSRREDRAFCCHG